MVVEPSASPIKSVVNQERQRDHYAVTVITSAFNVAAYITETVTSVFSQSWLAANEGELQMVVVNDGSTDETMAVLRKLATQYPDLLVVDKANTGVSNNRNVGATFARGRYWEFLDADDKLSQNAMARALAAFQQYPELKIVKFNRQFFEKATGAAEYYMADLTASQLVDTRQDPFHPVLHLSSMVFDQSLWEPDMFPQHLTYAEDAWVAGIMIEKSPVYYYAADATYWYRRRHDQSSLVDSYRENESKFLSQVKDYYEPYLQLIQTRFGQISGHIQSTILVSLSWNIKDHHVHSFYVGDYVERYIAAIGQLLQQFDDAIILGQHRILNYYQRHALVVLKHTGTLPLNHFYPTTVQQIAGQAVPVVAGADGRVIERFDNRKATIYVLKAIDHTLTITGSINVLFDLTLGQNFRLYLQNNTGQRVDFTENFPLRYRAYRFLDRDIKQVIGFSVKVPEQFYAQSTELTLIGEVDVAGQTYSTRFQWDFNGHFAWLVNHRAASYFADDQRLFSYAAKARQLTITPRSLRRQLWFEYHYYLEWRRLPAGQRGRHVIWWRQAANFVSWWHRLTHQTINLYMDRENSVWDNGTAMVLKHNELLATQKAKHERNYFVVTKSSAGFRDLKQRGVRVVPFGSWRHKLLMLTAKRLISSQTNLANYHPFRHEWQNLLNDKQCFEFFYLQHGVNIRQNTTPDNPWLTRTRLGIDHMLATNQIEYDFLIDPAKGTEFLPEEVILAGMARHDYLHVGGADRKRLLVMPTWRKKLAIWAPEGYRYNPAFKSSAHFQIWNQFLNNPQLHEALQREHVELVFAPHPLEQLQLKDYDLKYVDQVIASVENYNDLINNCAAFVTDFSSLGLDFVYAEKPLFVLDTGDDNWPNFDDRVSYQAGKFGAAATDPVKLGDAIVASAAQGFPVSPDVVQFRNQFFAPELDSPSVAEKVLRAYHII